jgi:putative transposase
VRASFLGSDPTYGARRVARSAGGWMSCGLHLIERLMRSQAFKARRRRRLPPDLGERQAGAVATNVLDRTFEASAANRKWIADFTDVWTAEGWLYVAAVIDLFCRRVVGWSMSAAMTAPTCHRCPGNGDLAKRQVRCAAASLRSRQPVHQRTIPTPDGHHGVVCSMSRSGNVWDNAAMGSFFSSRKTERTARKVYRSRDEAKAEMFDYIDRNAGTRRLDI